MWFVCGNFDVSPYTVAEMQIYVTSDLIKGYIHISLFAFNHSVLLCDRKEGFGLCPTIKVEYSTLVF